MAGTAGSDAGSAVDSDLEIIDAHHHLWAHAHGDYLPRETFLADLATDHNVTASVYVESGAWQRASGPDRLRPVGEAEVVGAFADAHAAGPARLCAAFVGGPDLTLGDAIDEVLDALDDACGGRLRGARISAVWDADPSVNTGTRPFAPENLLESDALRAGAARLAARGLVCDTHQYHPQLPKVAALADALPDLTVVVNHCGGLLGIGPYAGPETFAGWKAKVLDLARRPNVRMKLGGLSARRCGFGFETRGDRPGAEELAAIWRPYIETCIEAFGPGRCMFETNYPPDRVAGDYGTLWNVFKLIAADASASEKADLFADVARRTYRIG